MKCKKCKSDYLQKNVQFSIWEPRSAACRLQCRVLMTGKRLKTRQDDELIFLTIVINIYWVTTSSLGHCLDEMTVPILNNVDWEIDWEIIKKEMSCWWRVAKVLELELPNCYQQEEKEKPRVTWAGLCFLPSVDRRLSSTTVIPEVGHTASKLRFIFADNSFCNSFFIKHTITI